MLFLYLLSFFLYTDLYELSPANKQTVVVFFSLSGRKVIMVLDDL